jgi:uncharacterized protein YcbK (DUF882 family)
MRISKHFNREEFACKCGCGYDTVDIGLVAILEDARKHFDEPFIVTSGCRCEAHNKRVGGGDSSQHKLGRAADIHISGGVVHYAELYSYLDNKYTNTLGLGLYDDFVHIDSRRKKARW